MADMYKVKERLCRELEELMEHPQWNLNELEQVKMLTEAIHYIDESMEIEEGGGYSGRRRDSMGRYARDGGDYSGRYYPDPMAHYYSYENQGGTRGRSGDGDHMEKRLSEMENMLRDMKSTMRG